MAIARMQKIGVAGHGSVKAAVLAALHRCGMVHILDMREYAEKPEWRDLVSRADTADQSLEEYLGRLRQAIGFAERFEDGKKKKTPRQHIQVSRTEYERIISDFDHHAAVERLAALEKEYLELETTLNRLRQQKAHLEPWLNMDIPLRELTPTRNTDVFMGVLSTSMVVQLNLALRSATPLYHLEIVAQDERLSRVIIFFARECEQAILEVLKQVGFERVSFKEMGSVEGTPRAIVARLDCEIAALKKRQAEIEAEMSRAGDLRRRLVIVAEHIRHLCERARIQAFLATTSQAFLLEGWVLSAQLNKVRQALSGIREVTVTVLEPNPGETMPTEYDNVRVLRPYEFMTDLYDRPCQEEPDPTALFAPFFTLFFAVCLTDAAYGLILATLSFVLLKKGRLVGNARKLFTVLMYAGLTTVAVGIVTGGYFGIPFGDDFPEALAFLKNARAKLLLLDPMATPITFWHLALVLGILQINTGLFIKLYKQARIGRLRDGLLDQGAWILTIDALVPFFLVTVGLLPGLPPAFSEVCLICAGVGGAIILFFHGRAHKNPGVRLGGGAYSLYTIVTGSLGDILSYSRLFALGLATGVLALVVNMLASIIGGMIPVVGVVVAAVILIIGHSFNIVINALGGFIHSMRLQFVEYFGKFYDGGGKAFTPFSEQFSQVVIID